MNPFSSPGAVPKARPARSLRRQRLELLGLYLGTLAGILLVFALVVREGFRHIAMAEVRSELSVLGGELAALPLHQPGRERELQARFSDFAAAHQQLEWFEGEAHGPIASLGEVRTLGALPTRGAGQRMIWQERDDTLALVLPADAGGLDRQGKPRVWLRISQGLEPLESRMHQLDLALAVAISLALVLSAISAGLLARRLVDPLERSLRRLREFELDASHELRGPLAALAANAELGLLECPEGDTPQRRRFAAIASATDQMQGLVEDLLLLARQDQGPIASLQRLDVSALVAEQLELYGDALSLRCQQLTAALQPGLVVLGQAALLRQLVRNLIDNAHRYSPENATLEVRLERRGRQALLEVRDSGPGLDVEQLPRVFDRFWRASADRSDGGSGMGLAIAARICHSHGGEIQVFSAQGQGCRFVVSLPLAAG